MARPHNQPCVTQDIDATVCWMVDRPLVEGAKYVLKHTTRSGRALIKEVRYRLDVNTLHRDETVSTLGLNDIGRITLRTTTPVMVDPYRRNRTTGSFILIEEGTNTTAGAGMILDNA